LGQADATKERRKAMLQGFSIPQTTKRQRNHAPAALLRLGALAQRLTQNLINIFIIVIVVFIWLDFNPYCSI